MRPRSAERHAPAKQSWSRSACTRPAQWREVLRGPVATPWHGTMKSPTSPAMINFGKYVLTEKLATGGMAEIYRGKLFGPGGFEKQLVIKQIHPDLADRAEFVNMFVAEAKTTVSLSH